MKASSEKTRAPKNTADRVALATKAEEKVLAWHFIEKEGRLRGGAPTTELERFSGVPRLCFEGLHASVRALDAAYYAPGAIVRRVECGGTIILSEDKLVCTERRVLWTRDATTVARQYLKWIAEQLLVEIPIMEQVVTQINRSALEWLQKVVRTGDTSDTKKMHEELFRAGRMHDAAMRAYGSATWLLCETRNLPIGSVFQASCIYADVAGTRHCLSDPIKVGTTFFGDREAGTKGPWQNHRTAALAAANAHLEKLLLELGEGGPA